MNFRSLVLIISSIFMLLTPCSMKASIHTILEVENVQQTKSTPSKTIQSNTTSCVNIKFEVIKKSSKQLDLSHFDLPQISLQFIQYARSSLIVEDIDSNKIQSPKIPFYLLYKQLKYSLLS
ncbi:MULTISPECIES: hypothetical protein [unclassified Empedobacter]|uniref:hypothetical protein n=2 Tax=Empedobacter TaxID=59734 RepID=UPI001D3DFC6D|nr:MULTISPECIES: hypothetical protein [unclassified Empedobacter]MDM1523039.1 hypothetical protein [Empedobacter sp. 225-1]MDM1543588.1 hypothetical protein [Empedobacter sp. 189-2]HJD86299.1 hypothetical protein [Empedobacter falsenii]